MKIGKYASSKKITKTGIPQGSSLAPLFYIIYTNDMDEENSDVDTMMYADDTAVATEDGNLEDAITKLQNKVNNLSQWIEDNGLDINKEKTEFIIYASERNKQAKEIGEVKLSIRGALIKMKKQIKYLGLNWDKSISWNEQILETIKKIRTLMPLIKRIARITSEETKKEIYHAIIESRMAYGIEIWGSTSKTNMKRIQRTQNRILRILYNRRRDKNIDDIYKEKEIMRIYELHLNKEAERAWQIINKRSYSKNIKLNIVEPNHEAQTREQRTYRVKLERSKNKWGDKRANNRMAKIVNELEKEMQVLSDPNLKEKYPREKIREVWRNKGNKQLEKKFWA